MIGYDEALAIIRRETRQLSPQTCAGSVAIGRILARDVIAGEDLPPFDNSAMDGFALHVGAETAIAGSEFAVTGTQVAGDEHAHATPEGTWEIMTGARLPDGLDAIVPVEQVEVLEHDAHERPARIRLLAAVPPGQHVRRRGEDIARGTRILAAGTRIEAQQRMLLAALGVDDITVAPRPRVAVLSTGRELIDDPARALASGEIRNSNGPYLAQRVRNAGAELVHQETITDEVETFLAALERALAAGAELIVSTGAVSMGRHDFVPEALRRIGAVTHFHKVRIRPGKPLLFASLRAGQAYFGLPGNPVSGAVGMRFFVEPALRTMLGLAAERPLVLPLTTDFVKRAPMRFHLKGRLELAADGRLRARALPGQESFRIAPLAQANCWIVVPEDAPSLAAGSPVQVFGLGHLLPPRIDEVMT